MVDSLCDAKYGSTDWLLWWRCANIRSPWGGANPIPYTFQIVSSKYLQRVPTYDAIVTADLVNNYEHRIATMSLISILIGMD